MLNNIVYAIDLSNRSCLRNPSNFDEIDKEKEISRVNTLLKAVNSHLGKDDAKRTKGSPNNVYALLRQSDQPMSIYDIASYLNLAYSTIKVDIDILVDLDLLEIEGTSDNIRYKILDIDEKLVNKVQNILDEEYVVLKKADTDKAHERIEKAILSSKGKEFDQKKFQFKKERLAKIRKAVKGLTKKLGRKPYCAEVSRKIGLGEFVLGSWMLNNDIDYRTLGMLRSQVKFDRPLEKSFTFMGNEIFIPLELGGKIKIKEVSDNRDKTKKVILQGLEDSQDILTFIYNDKTGKFEIHYSNKKKDIEIASVIKRPDTVEINNIYNLESVILFRDAVLDIPSEYGIKRKEALSRSLEESGVESQLDEKTGAIIFSGKTLLLPPSYKGDDVKKLLITKNRFTNASLIKITDSNDRGNFIIIEEREGRLFLSGSGKEIISSKELGSSYNLAKADEFRDFDRVFGNLIERKGVIKSKDGLASISVLDKIIFSFHTKRDIEFTAIKTRIATNQEDEGEQPPLILIKRLDGLGKEILFWKNRANDEVIVTTQEHVDGKTITRNAFRFKDGRPLIFKGDRFNLNVILELDSMGVFDDAIEIDPYIYSIFYHPSAVNNLKRTYKLDIEKGTIEKGDLAYADALRYTDIKTGEIDEKAMFLTSLEKKGLIEDKEKEYYNDEMDKELKDYTYVNERIRALIKESEEKPVAERKKRIKGASKIVFTADPDSASRLGRYTGSGDTAIYVVLGEAKKNILRGNLEEVRQTKDILLSLLGDFVTIKDNTDIPPLMDKWNKLVVEKGWAVRSDVDLNLDNVNNALRDVMGLLYEITILEGVSGLNELVKNTEAKRSRENKQGVSLVSSISYRTKLGRSIKTFQNALEKEFRDKVSINRNLHFTITGIKVNQDEKMPDEEFLNIDQKIDQLLYGLKTDNFKIQFFNDITISPAGNITLTGYVDYSNGTNPVKFRNCIAQGLDGYGNIVKGFHVTLGSLKSRFTESDFGSFIGFLDSYREKVGEFGALDMREVKLVRHDNDYLVRPSKVARFPLKTEGKIEKRFKEAMGKEEFKDIKDFRIDDLGRFVFEKKLETKDSFITYYYNNSDVFDVKGDIGDLVTLYRESVSENIRYLAMKRLAKYRERASHVIPTLKEFLEEEESPRVKEEIDVAINLLSGKTIDGGERLDVVFAAYELAPFVEAGGVKDVMRQLPRVFRNKRGDNSYAVIPYWNEIVDEAISKDPTLEVKLVDSFELHGEEVGIYQILKREPGERIAEPIDGVPIYLLKSDAYFSNKKYNGFVDKKDIYRVALDKQRTDGTVDPDNARTSIFFSKAVLEALKTLKLRPDIINTGDWQTGLIPALLKKPKYPGDYAFFNSTEAVHTIHNMGPKGFLKASPFSSDPWEKGIWDFMGLSDDAYQPYDFNGLEFWGKSSLQKSGIVHSQPVTVSDTYADELKTVEGGAGFDSVVRNSGVLGIPNGVSLREWDSSISLPLGYRFKENPSIEDKELGVLDIEEGKKKNKEALVELIAKEREDKGINLEPFTCNGSTPLGIFVGRASYQKGLDILLRTLEEDNRLGWMLREGKFKFVILVSGDKDNDYVKWAKYLEEKYPNSVAFIGRFLGEEIKQLYAGADINIMPSLFEPGGLVQKQAACFGAVNIINRVGGPKDDIIDFTASDEYGNGYTLTFGDNQAHNEWLLSETVNRAVSDFNDKPKWSYQVKRVLQDSKKFAWDLSSLKYEVLFNMMKGNFREVFLPHRLDESYSIEDVNNFAVSSHIDHLIRQFDGIRRIGLQEKAGHLKDMCNYIRLASEKDGVIIGGYHNFAHSMEISRIATEILANSNIDGIQNEMVLEYMVASMLKDFNPGRGKDGIPIADNTIASLDEDRELYDMIKNRLGLNIKHVKAFILKMQFPMDTQAAKKSGEVLHTISPSVRDDINKLGRNLERADILSAYLLSTPEEMEERLKVFNTNTLEGMENLFETSIIPAFKGIPYNLQEKYKDTFNANKRYFSVEGRLEAVRYALLTAENVLQNPRLLDRALDTMLENGNEVNIVAKSNDEYQALSDLIGIDRIIELERRGVRFAVLDKYTDRNFVSDVIQKARSNKKENFIDIDGLIVININEMFTPDERETLQQILKNA
ncbi:MAG: glycogen/starch synthase [Candidatus Omnitrophota bacterium]